MCAALIKGGYFGVSKILSFFVLIKQIDKNHVSHFFWPCKIFILFYFRYKTTTFGDHLKVTRGGPKRLICSIVRVSSRLDSNKAKNIEITHLVRELAWRVVFLKSITIHSTLYNPDDGKIDIK